MSEPTPKRPDPTRPAAQQPTKGQIPVAKRLEADQPKSSPVISTKSYRVRELPPPPIIEPPRADRTEADDVPHHDTMPEGLSAPPEKPQGPAIELDALQIRAPERWSLLRRRVHLPPRWQQWLADPQRRNPVGVGLSIAIHIAMIVLLALVLRWPARTPAAEPICARIVQPVASDVAAAQPASAVRLREPVVRQVTAGALETVALEPPPDLESEISNRKSKIPDVGHREQEAKLDPPVKMAEGFVLQPTGSEARPTVPPRLHHPRLRHPRRIPRREWLPGRDYRPICSRRSMP